jgi:hypothetical protein
VGFVSSQQGQGSKEGSKSTRTDVLRKQAMHKFATTIKTEENVSCMASRSLSTNRSL